MIKIGCFLLFPVLLASCGGNETTCVPRCEGRACGADGCGGVCGTCGADEQCASDSTCQCTHAACAGACCAEGDVCYESACCAPSCVGRDCGGDGCGGACGSCGDNATCVGTGCRCDFAACGDVCCPRDDTCYLGSCCTPDCAGRECGPDGCGGVCGTCDAGLSCSLTSVCAPWQRGNTHTHSNLSDGDASPEQVAQTYQGLGYNFLFLTDHGRLASDFDQYSSGDFIGINGEEVGRSFCHMSSLAASEGVGSTTLGGIQEVIDHILSIGGVPILNHPAWSSLPLSVTDLWPLERLKLMEIYNHITDLGYDEGQWDAMLTSGKEIFGVAADDCHAVGTGSGGGWVMVRTQTLAPSGILEAMQMGDFYASTGVTVSSIAAETDRLEIESANGEYIEFIGQGGRVLQSMIGSAGEYLFTGDEHYVRARITSSEGKAWTQPILLQDFSRDPYADAVVETNVAAPSSLEPILGPPLPGKVPSDWEKHGGRISAGEYAVFDMGENEDIEDTDGADLYIEEVDDEDGVGVADPYDVAVSEDGLAWVSVGSGQGDSYFDIGAAGVSSARYVKISVTAGDAEIEGMMFLDPSLRDPDADSVVEAAGVTPGHKAPHILGPRYPGQIPSSSWTMVAVQITAGGHIVLDMGAGEEIADGTGADLQIEEVDAEDFDGAGADPYSVSASLNGVDWVDLGDGTGDATFDLGGGGLARARYIRIDVTSGDAELDAVSAL